MKKKLNIFILFILLVGNIYSQESTRINNIKNHIELLKIDNPGLEEIINTNITQTSLANFLLAISEIHNLNINVSPELNNINIVNNFSNVTVDNIILFLIKEYDLEVTFTGNIISIYKYNPPPPELKEKEIKVTYFPENELMSLDLKNNKLEKVFRKIMDVSGKNILYSPEIENSFLSLYINKVPFETALSKIAKSNNLSFSKSRDGFYVFDKTYLEDIVEGDKSISRPRRRSTGNFYYKVTDTINKIIDVDFQNTPIADIIYTIGEDLNIDIFTASPLGNAGFATVKAEDIHFDLLLNKIFESGHMNETSENSNNEFKGSSNFTYKKEDDIYYFGTKNQFSLKQVELIPMVYRSIQSLSNPSGNGQRRAGGNSIVNNNLNYYNKGGDELNRSVNNNTNNNYGNEVNNISSIENIIPSDIKNGLDIKIDTELNSFIVSGPAIQVENFKKFITYIDKPIPVILIEVMILEVNRSNITETGVSFGLGEEPSNTSGGIYPSTDLHLGAKRINRIIGGFNGFGSLNIGRVLPEFYLDIKALETNGKIKILSTPKLSTINGHKAYLSSGQTTYYAVTSQSFYGSQIPQTSEVKNYVPIDAELALEILPFVSGDGEITLDIQVIQSAFNGERIADDAPPGINSREFSSIIRMRDQDVAILGGIEEVRKDDSGSGVPLLARIPVIKWLFSKRRREATNRKLNILIKPTVIN